MIILGSLQGKRIVDLLLVLIELFSLGVTAEALRANIGLVSAISLQRGQVDPKFQVEVVAPTNHSSYQKTRLNDLVLTYFSHYLRLSLVRQHESPCVAFLVALSLILNIFYNSFYMIVQPQIKKS